MTKNYFVEKYVGYKKLVCCKTRTQAELFLSYAEKFGYCWNDKDKYSSNSCWKDCSGFIYYDIYSGEYCRESYVAQNEYNIVEFEESSELLRIKL